MLAHLLESNTIFQAYARINDQFYRVRHFYTHSLAAEGKTAEETVFEVRGEEDRSVQVYMNSLN